jgi:uncharacterized membrane protein HdeD (DUF308 family)
MRVIPSIDDLSTVWQLLVVRGVIVLALSVAALPWPITSISAVLIIMATAALVAALFDAAIGGALQSRLASGWALLPEALLGALVGGAVLLYPLVSLGTVTVLMSLWMVVRGTMLVLVARGTSSHPVVSMLATGWLLVSLIVPGALLFHWRDATIVSTLEALVAYVLIWSASELVIGLLLRARAAPNATAAPTQQARS